MANKVNNLNYANTFGDWLISTNKLVGEVNALGFSTYTKPTGTIYLNDPTLGLQVTSNAIVSGALFVQGIGSHATVQNNLNVGGTISGNVNGNLIAANTTVTGNLIVTGSIVGNVAAADLPATGVVAKTYGDASNIPVINVGADGRLYSVSNTNVYIPPSTPISNDTANNVTRYITFTDSITGNLTSIYTSSTNLSFNPYTGTVTAGSFSATSDQRLKENVETIYNALNTVEQLRGVTFTWKSNQINSLGVIAQEVEKVLPEVITEADGLKHVSYGNIVGVLIEAIKELNQKVQQLENQINKE
jgi:hypothetical protein